MKYNFDEIIDRRNTNCCKYDFAKEFGLPEDVLPLWVADMDFMTPPAVRDALGNIAAHGIYGYTDAKADYYEAVGSWFERRFGWRLERDWLVQSPGVVFAINVAIRALTEEGDGVLIQQPVYYPFKNSIQANRRKVVNNPLVLKDGRYEMDFDDLEQKIVSEQVKMMILCSPHNPVGRVWTPGELQRVAEICKKHDVYVVSDEIHADFTYAGVTHHMMAKAAPELCDTLITCTAPSKTFNLAGLQASNIIITNPKLRKKYKAEMRRTGYGSLNVMGYAACQAAYTCGGDWLDELKVYLKGNLDYMRQFLKERIPQVTLVEPEGTYLVWVDLRALHLTQEEQKDLIVNKARLWLDTGTMFGAEGRGFERFNIACPRATLTEALQRLERGVKEYMVR